MNHRFDDSIFDASNLGCCKLEDRLKCSGGTKILIHLIIRFKIRVEKVFFF